MNLPFHSRTTNEFLVGTINFLIDSVWNEDSLQNIIGDREGLPDNIIQSLLFVILSVHGLISD